MSTTNTTNNVRLYGRVSKYVAHRGWGIIHKYFPGDQLPTKYFFHFSNVQVGVVVKVGMRVSFTPAPPREEGLLQSAVQIVPAEDKSVGGDQ